MGVKKGVGGQTYMNTFNHEWINFITIHHTVIHTCRGKLPYTLVL